MQVLEPVRGPAVSNADVPPVPVPVESDIVRRNCFWEATGSWVVYEPCPLLYADAGIEILYGVEKVY